MKMTGRALLALCFLACFCPGAGAAEPAAIDFDAWCRDLDSRPESRTSLFFSPEIGQELDADEGSRYGLFGHTGGFRSARLPVDPKGDFHLDLTLQSISDQFRVQRRFSASSLRLTRLHFYLSERFRALPPLDSSGQEEADLLLRLALRFAARGRYDLVQGVLEDLRGDFPETQAGLTANWLLPEVRALQADRRVLVWDQPTQGGGGGNDLKLFGGYYGLWLGLAIPLALDADSPEAYGAGLMAGGPVGFFLASWAAGRWDITEGQATMIELGGNLGTWQGLGWAEVQGADGPDIVGSGVLAGLAGIGAASWLTSRYEFSEGHAALTAAAGPWGAWFGLVAAVISETETDDGWDFHKSMLIGSDALVLTTGVLARKAEMSEKRVRLISLNGIIGSVMGLGLTLIAQPDDGGSVMAIIGACGAGGLAAGFALTSGVDGDRYAGGFSGERTDGAELASGPEFRFPQVSVQPNLMTGHGVMPAVGAGVRF